jgi:heat shock protein HslJ
MKFLSLSLTLLTLGLVLSAGTCSKSSGSAMSETITQGRWQLEKLNGAPIQLPEGTEEKPYLEVDSSATRLTGYGGCNRLMGQVKVDGGNISFPGLGGTKRYCEKTMDLERNFMKALGETTAYTLKDDQLTLLNNGTEVATLVHKK